VFYELRTTSNGAQRVSVAALIFTFDAIGVEYWINHLATGYSYFMSFSIQFEL
jgi:hypothetical protein